MIFDTLTMYEQELVLRGFDGMTLENQNKLISLVATKLNTSLIQVRAEHILTHHKNIKIAMINESCEIAISQGFTSVNGHRYRLNLDDQINFLGMKNRVDDKPDMIEVMWKSEDAGYIAHTRTEWIKVQEEAFDHKLIQLMKYNEKFTAINTATDHAVIVATKW